MSRNATIHRAHLELSHVDRGVYADRPLTIARHPSETIERMVMRLLAFGLRSTLSRLGPEVELRDVPHSPDDGAIADYRGEIGDPAALAARLEADPGISSHGLFPPAMVSEVLIGAGDSVNRLTLD